MSERLFMSPDELKKARQARADFLRLERAKKKITIKKLSQISGVSAHTISDIENNVCSWGINTENILINALNKL